MFIFAPLARYLPWPALSGVLILTAYGMVDKAEIARILRSTQGDAFIMVATFLGTMFLPLEFAVMMGILLSFAFYITKTSIPQIINVVPDKDFKHFIKVESRHDLCPQLAILQISGDLYFGAVSHVEETIRKYFQTHSEDRFLLVRMHSVNHCDFSGIHMLESVHAMCHERGGDLYFVRVQEGVFQFMQSTGFYKSLGEDHFLDDEKAVSYMFQKILDPAVCVYECPVRVFKECQNLPKRTYQLPATWATSGGTGPVDYILPRDLWKALHGDATTPLAPQVIDVREPREFKVGHIVEAHLVPLPKLLITMKIVPKDEYLVVVCRGGRRSTRAAQLLQNQGYKNIKVLQGGMLAWETAGLLEAID
jgi:SulP family sulfate permease